MRHALGPGSEVGGYRIGELLGEGATGAVYRAGDAEGRTVALKVLDRELATDARFRERFLRESGVAAILQHPSIVPVLAAGEDDGVLFLAMEWVDGSDLRDLLRRDGPFEPERAVALIEDVAAGLDEAHAAGLIHRDVKPANILVAGDRARLCDFGLAKHTARAESLTGERMLVGTLAYIAPEQIEGAGVDARADVYALGCVLYECLTGEPPFDRDSEMAVLYAHLNEPPPRPGARRPELPAAFDDVVATALAKAPADRPESCGALARAARAALRGDGPRRRRRRGALVAAAAAGAVAVAATAAVVLGSGSDDPPAPARAPRRSRRPRRGRRGHGPARGPGPPAGQAGRRARGRALRLGAARRAPAARQGGRPEPARRGVARAPVPAGRDGGGRRRALGRGGGRTARGADRGAQRPRGAHAARAARRREAPARSRSAPARCGSAADPRSCASSPARAGCWRGCGRRST